MIKDAIANFLPGRAVAVRAVSLPTEVALLIDARLAHAQMHFRQIAG